MITVIIRNDRFRIFMTDNINEQPIEFVSNSESKYIMGFTNRNRRVRIWKTGRNTPYDQMVNQMTDDNVVFDAPYNNTCIIDRRE